jgi:SAM-dependent methyltransferase
MRLLGPDPGFKAAVAVVYVSSAAVIYAAARTVAALPPNAAALATLLVALSPALFRAFLFGQYPSLMSFLFFWGLLAVFFAALRSKHADARLATLGALLLGLLGSIQLYPMFLLPLVMAPLLLLFSVGRLIRRLVPAIVTGILLALLPSIMLLIDFGRFAKTPVPHVTRSLEMVEAQGLLEWVLLPAGLPMVLGLLILAPHLIVRKRGAEIGMVLVAALVFYLRTALPAYWLLAILVTAALLALAMPRNIHWARRHRLSLFLSVAGMLSLWLALGPHGGLARLAPFSEILVYDRFLLFGVPFGFFAIVHVLWSRSEANPPQRRLLVALGITSLLLMGFSLQQVIEQYRQIVPGAQGRLPQGTVIPEDVWRALKADRGYGRVLPLGLPREAYAIPDATERPLIDGAYNDARQLDPLRRSGLETLGNEKFTNADLPMVRFFLANADAYGIKWVITGDRSYDKAIPLDGFKLILESGADPDRSIRIYRSIHELGQAWEGPIRYRVSQVGMLGTDRLGSFGIGGGTEEVDRSREASTLNLIMHGSTTHGWAFSELELGEEAQSCNQIAFQAWSPTGASLAVKTLRQNQWLLARPEIPLSRRPQWLILAVDCREVQRLQFAFAGSGLHQAFMSPIILRQIQSTTGRVSFEQMGPECFRVAIPSNNRSITVSLASFPRWRSLDSNTSLHVGSNKLGLLTLRGPAGNHLVCLAFPTIFRLARSLLPIAYLGILSFVLALFALRERPILSSLYKSLFAAHLLSLITSFREIAMRRWLQPERAWDLRARERPYWYISYSNSALESEAAAIADLEEVLDGFDRAWLKQGTVLEIGCGAGRLLKAIAHKVRKAYGVDFSGEMVRLAQARLREFSNVITLKNDGSSLSMFENEKFDFVFSFAVFQHIPTRANIEAYLREIHRVLKPMGEVKLQVDGRDNVFWRLLKRLIGNDSWSGIFFSRGELLAIARAHGFKVIRLGHRPSRRGVLGLQNLWIHMRKPSSLERIPAQEGQSPYESA